ncbi:MAG: CRP/FNR family transcriptional regulator [Kiritimatiellia bacterium]|jgi:CRP/FNR family transcriptional regulator
MNAISKLPHNISNVNPATIASTLSALPNIHVAINSNTTACHDCRLNTLCLSKNLNTKDLTALSKIAKTLSPLRKRQHLFRQGDKFNSLFLVRSGSVKSYSTNVSGDELGVNFYLPGELIGLDGVYTKEHGSSVVALEDTFLCELPYHALEKLFIAQPLVQSHFNELLSRQMVQEHAITLMHSQKTADDRLVAFLLNLSQRFKRLKQSPVSFRLPMPRKDIAGCLGLAHETISRLFSEFQHRDWMEVSGREVRLLNLPNDGLSY